MPDAKWDVYLFRVFFDMVDRLANDVEELLAKHTADYYTHPKVKLLASVYQATRKDVPANPKDRKFLLGHTLGPQHADWRRVKHGIPQRYRIFFKFFSKTQESGDIIFAWMNDETTLRKDGDKNDVYAVFARLLARGEIPSRFEALMARSLPPDSTAEQYDEQDEKLSKRVTS